VVEAEQKHVPTRPAAGRIGSSSRAFCGLRAAKESLNYFFFDTFLEIFILNFMFIGIYFIIYITISGRKYYGKS